MAPVPLIVPPRVKLPPPAVVFIVSVPDSAKLSLIVCRLVLLFVMPVVSVKPLGFPPTVPALIV